MADDLSVESIGAKLRPPPQSVVPDREQPVVQDVEDVPCSANNDTESVPSHADSAEPASGSEVVIRPRTTKHGLVIGSSRIQSKEERKAAQRRNQKGASPFMERHHTPTSLTAEQEQKWVPLVEELCDRGYDTKPEFNAYLRKCMRARKVNGRNSDVARVYRYLIAEQRLKPHPQLEFLLRTKVGKSASGILSITVFTSPWPDYIDPKTGKQKIQRFTCKWDCYFCPNHPGHPRSYLPDEPGCLRAERLDFDPIRQLQERVHTLRAIGHPVDKLEVLVLGGTWESYPASYRERFVRDLFYASNTFFDLAKLLYEEAKRRDLAGETISSPSALTEADLRAKLRPPLSMAEEQVINESAQCKIIGLTLETRPDTITPEVVRTLRSYGCTRLQLGVQHIDDEILRKVNRRHTIAEAARALQLLKDSCYKVDIHLMPDLPSATVEKDRAMFASLLGTKSVTKVRCPADAQGTDEEPEHRFIYELVNEDIQADQWKIYPCEVTPWTVIEKWYKQGKYKPYAGPPLVDLLLWTKERVFPWIRLNRVIRDIPNQHIIAGNDNTSLRQDLLALMKKQGKRCACIRCREVGLNAPRTATQSAQLVVRKYSAHGGTEYFISYESPDQLVIFGFLRLRISENAGKETFSCLEGAGLVRELHVYGQLVPTYVPSERTPEQLARAAERAKEAERELVRKTAKMNRKRAKKGLPPLPARQNMHVHRAAQEQHQHAGFGKRLMARAEVLTREHGLSKVAVIAGVGTRNYYRKLGYELQDTFLVKELPPLPASHKSSLEWASHRKHPRTLAWALVLAVLAALVAWWLSPISQQPWA